MPSQLEVQIRQVSPTTSEAEMGKHRVLIDRPEPKGGADLGPMGGQLFLASVGGCFLSNLLAAIKTRQAPVDAVRIQVTGTVEESPARFSAIDLLVTAEYKDRDLMDRLIQIADRGCIMMNTLRGKLGIAVRIGPPL